MAVYPIPAPTPLPPRNGKTFLGTLLWIVVWLIAVGFLAALSLFFVLPNLRHTAFAEPEAEPTHISALVNQLNDKDTNVARRAVFNLAKYGKQSCEKLAKKMAENDSEASKRASLTLVMIGEPAVPEIIQYDLSSDNPEVRQRARRMLAAIGGQKAKNELIKGLDSRNAAVSVSSEQVLEDICSSQENLEKVLDSILGKAELAKTTADEAAAKAKEASDKLDAEGKKTEERFNAFRQNWQSTEKLLDKLAIKYSELQKALNSNGDNLVEVRSLATGAQRPLAELKNKLEALVRIDIEHAAAIKVAVRDSEEAIEAIKRIPLLEKSVQEAKDSAKAALEASDRTLRALRADIEARAKTKTAPVSATVTTVVTPAIATAPAATPPPTYVTPAPPAPTYQSCPPGYCPVK